MSSFVWDRDIEEAFQEPYEYPGQEQFFREAKNILDSLKIFFSKKNKAFNVEEETLEKAIWMLQVDVLEAMNDALTLINEKKHRIAARLFRDIIETLDISVYFTFGGKKAENDLKKWYKNEVIPHKNYREFVKHNYGEDQAKQSSIEYGDFSKYTHRTYRAIGMSYIRGQENKLFYDGFEKSDILVLPHVISFSYAVLAALIKRFVKLVVHTKQITEKEAEVIWNECLEKESVPRRFGNGTGQLKRGPTIEFKIE